MSDGASQEETDVPDLLGDWQRTHTCGALREEHVGQQATLLGWAHRVRDLGALVFIDLRDRYGITQVVVRDDEATLERAKRIRAEFVVGVRGTVRQRDPDTRNPKLETGDIELVAEEIRLLNEARTPPFSIADDTPVSEDVRLRYRFLDLRRPRMQANLALRHRLALAVRKHLDERGFWEVETPILTKSTPEGARDYLVPSRVHPGQFYALPQSPQLFKQLLMIAGIDRYFQIVRCFRDEDLRADRQPEFTQIDLEISFATRELVFSVVESLVADMFAAAGLSIERPFRRVPYADAIAGYGSDKPDLRFDMAIRDFTHAFRDSGFELFRGAIDSGGVVRGFVVAGGGRYSRRELDELTEQAKRAGLAALVWARRTDDGAIQSPALKTAGAALAQALDQAGAGKGDLLVMAAGPADATSRALGTLRLVVGKKEGFLQRDRFAVAWVVDFPLLEWNPEEQRWDAVQHPFTAPLDEDLVRLEQEPGRVRGQIYDLVLNGWEIAGGSIRIHEAALQSRIFRLLRISDEEARRRFGFFLDALEYGTPPHGGIALGFDRIVAILAGESSIREVIAFPKTAAAVDLMAGAPSPVDARQLRELHLK